MWFNIQIKIQGDYSNYLNFTNKYYDSLNNISTISFEVFTPNLHHLYDKVINEYTDSHEFIKALEEYKINEIPLKDLEDLHKFLKNTAMYKSSYLNNASPILDTGNKVFFNRDDAYYKDYLKVTGFKKMLSDSNLTAEMPFSLKTNEDRIIMFLIEKASSILSIKVIPKDTTDYTFRSTTFKKDIFKDISEALAHRYAVLPKPGKVRNLIVDSFLPQYFIKHKFNLENIQEEFKNISSTATMIHRGFARMLGIRELPLDDMLAMIGYTKQRITELLTNVRAKKFNIAFAGYGGVGTNTIYWLTELCNMTNIQGLFNKIIISDFDKLSLDNVFRMPNPFKTFSALKHKYMLFNGSTNSYINTEYRENSLYKTQTIPENSLKALSAKAPYYENRELRGQTFSIKHTRDIYDWIVYGAPDIESRKMLSKVINKDLSEYCNYWDIYLAKRIKVFISATHGDDICELSINPSYLENESNLMIESYGIIQLNVFFFNQLRLAISFLEALEKYSIYELEEFRDEVFLKDYSIVDNQKSNKYNIAFQNVRTINTVENIEREA